MTDRDPSWPIALAAILALIIHAAAIPAFSRALSRQQLNTNAPHIQPLLPDPQTTLGQKTPRKSSVAWINHDDFKKLVAPTADALQPAIQESADPTDPAPLEQTPTNTTPQLASIATPTPPLLPDPSLPDQQPTDAPNQQPGAPLQLEPTPIPDQIAAAPTEPTATDQANEPTPPEPTQPIDSPPTPPTPPTDNPGPPKPTAAPRKDSESSAAQTTPTVKATRPGAVLAAQGIEVKTAFIKPSAVTRYSTIPSNPIVAITFDTQGQPINARFIKTTGSANWDATILASLYRWSATGPKLEQRNKPLTIEVQITLTRD